MLAAKYRLGNLVAILDYNGTQQTGATADVMPHEPIAAKWKAFGWHVQEIGGHNVREVLEALDRADQVHARPAVIISRTTKGARRIVHGVRPQLARHGAHRGAVRRRQGRAGSGDAAVAELINTRVAYGKALIELGRSNPDVVVLSADVSNSDHSFMFADESSPTASSTPASPSSRWWTARSGCRWPARSPSSTPSRCFSPPVPWR